LTVQTLSSPGRIDLALSTLTPGMGAEVLGLDLAQASDETILAIQSALDRHKVLVFRDQTLTRAEHKTLAKRFATGELHRHPLAIAKAMEDAEIAVIHTDENSTYTGGDLWHSDTTAYRAPVAASLLYLTEMPTNGGGDTVFADMNTSWGALSTPMQDFLADKRAVHDSAMPWGGMYGHKAEDIGAFPKTSHPVRLVHPRTGKPLLFVNRAFTTHIEGLSKAESRYLLDFLFTHIETTMTTHCRVKWQTNTLVLWDNIATQHHAVWDYYPQRRHAERVSVMGHPLPNSISLKD
jgi:taurine dioxygenase